MLTVKTNLQSVTTMVELVKSELNCSFGGYVDERHFDDRSLIIKGLSLGLGMKRWMISKKPFEESSLAYQVTT